jgi:UDP-glucose 4-epimerase
MAKYLVTGGAGFIGSHMVERLLKEGNEVVCFDNLSTGSLDNIRDFKENPNFQFIQGNILDIKALNNSFKNVEYIFHYAAVVGVKRTIENPLDVLNTNIEGTRNVLELSVKHGVEKVIFASSSEVYGDPVEIPERENGHVNAKLPYAISKLVGENYCRAYYEKFGLKTTSLRFFNVYGPGQESTPYGFVVGIFIRQALSNQPITIFGDGVQTRDFVFIADNVNDSMIAAEKNTTNGEVLNIGTGKPTTILDLAEEIVDIVGNDIEMRFLPEREDDIKHRFTDISKMRKLLEYKPRYKLREGLEITVDWYKSKLKA